MAFTLFSTYQLQEKILGSIDQTEEIAFLTSTSPSMVWLYAKKTKSGTLETSTANSQSKIMMIQDSNGTYAPTVKSGYKLIDFGFSLGVAYTCPKLVWYTSEDARLLPHGPLNVSNLVNYYQEYRYAYIPNGTNSNKFIRWIIGKGPPPYHYSPPPREPIYLESLYKTQKFYDPNTR